MRRRSGSYGSVLAPPSLAESSLRHYFVIFTGAESDPTVVFAIGAVEHEAMEVQIEIGA